MILKFSKFERVAGLFVLVALFGALMLTGITAIKKGWFAAKINYHTKVSSADGIRPGTPVTISGIRAGEITDVELINADEIIVHFEILDKFQKNIRGDSVVQVVRPFVIGDRSLELTVGSESEPMMKNGAYLNAVAGFDMMDLISGKRLAPFLGTIEALVKNLSTLAKAFSDSKRADAFIKTFDRLDPLVVNMGSMATEVTKLSKEINAFLPDLRKESPQVGKHIGELVEQLATLTKTLQPTFKEIGPELPQASRRALEALDEMVVTLKALQKSFLLSGKVEDVREEEKQRERKPSSK